MPALGRRVETAPAAGSQGTFIMTFVPRLAALAAAALLLAPAGASAHVALAVTGAAAPGTTNLFGFGPGHGCAGSPTVAVAIKIPEGISAVKPVAKPGWSIDIVAGAEPGSVAEVHFTGGNLPDAWFDQFWIRAKIDAGAAPGSRIWFPVVQSCASGENAWIAIPAAGQPEPEEPAPGFTVNAPAAGAPEAAAPAH